jgi:hypothetical protein
MTKATEKKEKTGKVFVSKLQKKERIFTHNVNGLLVKTSCNIFGAPMTDDNYNLVGGCNKDNCLQSEYVRSQCMLNGIKPMTIEEIEAAKKGNGKKSGLKRVASTGGKDKEKDLSFEVFVNLFKLDTPKTVIIQAMINSGMTESASKTLYGKLSCVTGACLRPNLKDSTIYQVARHILQGGPMPEGDKSSIAFCTRVAVAWLGNQDDEVIVC